MELQDKIGTGDGAAGTAASAEPAVSGIGDEVTAALTGLGYSVQEAGPVVERLAPDYETVEDLLRACLRALGTGR